MEAHHHYIHRTGWLRAAVLGANDGILSTASLLVGVAAAGSGQTQIVLAGVAGLVAGALAMAAGEYVSVSSQSDTERADLAREAQWLAHKPEAELEELTQIYIDRGLERDLAAQVALQLTQKDALATHAREELGITDFGAAQPVQAALVSALTFSLGALIPLAAAYSTPDFAIYAIVAATLVALTTLGALGAFAGGASLWRGAWRVCFWGALSMGLTALVGHMFAVNL